MRQSGRVAGTCTTVGVVKPSAVKVYENYSTGLGTGGAAAAYITVVLLTHGRFTYKAGSHLIYTLERPYNSFRDSFDRVGS